MADDVVWLMSIALSINRTREKTTGISFMQIFVDFLRNYLSNILLN